MRTPLCLLAVIASVAACNSPTGEGDAGGGPDAGGGLDGGDAGLPPGTMSYSVHVGGLSVSAGTQVVYCANVHLHNPQPIDVIGFTSVQSPGGHHVIVVANNTDQPDSAPVECGQGETLNPQKGSMIYVSQIEQDSQLFPPRVGMSLPANASLLVQVHYIDATPNDLTIDSTITVLAGAPGSVTVAAAPLLFYDYSLQVPQGQSSSTAICPIPAGPDMSFFMVAGHMHSHGMDFKLDFTDLDGGNSQIYETTAWDSPPEQWLTPPLLVHPGAQFTWTCSYENADGGTINQPDEMCAVLGLYYPAPAGSLSLFYQDGICIPVYGDQDAGLGF